jgi:hypothetical protein
MQSRAKKIPHTNPTNYKYEKGFAWISLLLI